MTKPRLGVLVSGSGRHLRNLLELARSGSLPVEPVIAIASRAGIGAIGHAADFELPCPILKPGEVTAALEQARVDMVVLAGYLKHWDIPESFVGRALNIHPSLLPLFGGQGFYGHRVHEAVLASGMRVSGCTVHLVTRDYDAGPILVQRACPVEDDDTADSLAARVFAEELIALPEAVRLLARGRPRIDGRRARFGA